MSVFSFNSIPVPVALQVINSQISACTNFTYVCKIPTEKFNKHLEFTITNCIFYFNKKFYKQLQDATMGSPVSLVIANIYMEYFESLAICSSPTLIMYVVQVCWWCPQCHQERSSQQTSKALQFYRSTHQICNRMPRNRWTPLPRYPDQTHS